MKIFLRKLNWPRNVTAQSRGTIKKREPLAENFLDFRLGLKETISIERDIMRFTSRRETERNFFRCNACERKREKEKEEKKLKCPQWRRKSPPCPANFRHLHLPACRFLSPLVMATLDNEDIHRRRTCKRFLSNQLHCC